VRALGPNIIDEADLLPTLRHRVLAPRDIHDLFTEATCAIHKKFQSHDINRTKGWANVGFPGETTGRPGIGPSPFGRSPPLTSARTDTDAPSNIF
jgi:hypothetical protein